MSTALTTDPPLIEMFIQFQNPIDIQIILITLDVLI